MGLSCKTDEWSLDSRRFFPPPLSTGPPLQTFPEFLAGTESPLTRSNTHQVEFGNPALTDAQNLAACLDSL